MKNLFLLAALLSTSVFASEVKETVIGQTVYVVQEYKITNDECSNLTKLDYSSYGHSLYSCQFDLPAKIQLGSHDIVAAGEAEFLTYAFKSDVCDVQLVLGTKKLITKISNIEGKPMLSIEQATECSQVAFSDLMQKSFVFKRGIYTTR